MMGRGVGSSPAPAQSPGPWDAAAVTPHPPRALTFHQRLKDDSVQLLGALLLKVVHGEQVWVRGDVLQLGHQDKGPEVALGAGTRRWTGMDWALGV